VPHVDRSKFLLYIFNIQYISYPLYIINI
jgi:hypothetical protein